MHNDPSSSPPGEPGPTLRSTSPILNFPPNVPHTNIQPNPYGYISARPPRTANEFEIEYLRLCIHCAIDKIDRKTSDLASCRAQIDEHEKIIAQQNEHVAALEDLVHKQKITISNQSKTISDPRLLRRVHVGSASASASASVSQLSISTLSSASASAGGAGGAGMLPLVSSQQGEVNPPGSATSSGFDSGDGLSLPCELTNVSLKTQTGSNAAEISSRFRDLWAKTELFSQLYTNTPNAFSDSHLDTRVKDYIMTVSDKHGASSLLESRATRFFLVTKAVNFFLAQEVLKDTVVISGFNNETDAEVFSLMDQLTSDTPGPVRHLLAISLVTQVQITRSKPGFVEFCQHKTRENTLRLWQLVGPLTDTGTQIQTQTQAWTDLSSIISDAQNLALDMFSVPLEYSVDFPAMGDLVNASTMVNIDPFVPGEPRGLAGSDWRVRLGVTPVVRARDNCSDAASVSVVSLGHVLLRPGQVYR